jgi:hypothetical protein
MGLREHSSPPLWKPTLAERTALLSAWKAWNRGWLAACAGGDEVMRGFMSSGARGHGTHRALP